MSATVVVDADERMKQLAVALEKQQPPSDSCFFVFLWALLFLAPICYCTLFLVYEPGRESLSSNISATNNNNNNNEKNYALRDSLGIECASTGSSGSPLIIFPAAAKTATVPLMFQRTSGSSADRGSDNLLLFRPQSVADVWPPPASDKGLAAYWRCVSACPKRVSDPTILAELQASSSPSLLAKSKAAEYFIWSYSANTSSSVSVGDGVVAFVSMQDTFPLGGKLCVPGGEQQQQQFFLAARWSAVELQSSVRLLLLCVAVAAGLAFGVLYAMRLMLRGVVMVGGVFTIISLGVLAYALREESRRLFAAADSGNILFVQSASEHLHRASIVMLSLLAALVCFGYLARGSFIPRVATFLKVATKIAVLAPSSAFLPMLVAVAWCGLAAAPTLILWVMLAMDITRGAGVTTVVAAGAAGANNYTASGPLNKNASLAGWFSTSTSSSSSSSSPSEDHHAATAAATAMIPLSLGYATLGLILSLYLAQTTARAVMSALLSGPAFFWLESSTARKSCSFIPHVAQSATTCWRFILGCSTASNGSRGNSAPLPHHVHSRTSFAGLPSVLIAAMVQCLVDDAALFLSCCMVMWRWAFEGTLLAVPSAAPWYCGGCLVRPPMPQANRITAALLSCSSLFDPCTACIGRRATYGRSVRLVHAAALRHAGAAALPLLLGAELFVRILSLGIAAACAVLAWWVSPESASANVATDVAGGASNDRYNTLLTLSSLFVDDAGLLLQPRGEVALVRFNAIPLLVAFWICYVVASAFLAVFPTLCKAAVMSYHINRWEDSKGLELADEEISEINNDDGGSREVMTNMNTRSGDDDDHNLDDDDDDEYGKGAAGRETQATSLEMIALFERVDGLSGTMTEFDVQPPAAPMKIVGNS